MDNYNPAKMLEFSERGDERGNLVVVEGAIDVPFEIKFWSTWLGPVRSK